MILLESKCSQIDVLLGSIGYLRVLYIYTLWDYRGHVLGGCKAPYKPTGIVIGWHQRIHDL